MKILSSAELIEKYTSLYEKIHTCYHKNLKKKSDVILTMLKDIDKKLNDIYEDFKKEKDLIRTTIQEISNSINNEETSCTVCRENFEKIGYNIDIIPYCGHILCNNCYNQIRQCSICPICRYAFGHECDMFSGVEHKSLDLNFTAFISIVIDQNPKMRLLHGASHENSDISSALKIKQLVDQIDIIKRQDNIGEKNGKMHDRLLNSISYNTIPNSTTESDKLDIKLFYKKAKAFWKILNTNCVTVCEIKYGDIALKCEECKKSIFKISNKDLYVALYENENEAAFICKSCYLKTDNYEFVAAQQMLYVPYVYKSSQYFNFEDAL